MSSSKDQIIANLQKQLASERAVSQRKLDSERAVSQRKLDDSQRTIEKLEEKLKSKEKGDILFAQVSIASKTVTHNFIIYISS